MRFKFVLSLAAVCTIALFSCQKDLSIESNPGGQTQSVLSDSTYLDKIYYVDGATGDTDAVDIYTYDTARRVTGISERDYPLTAAGDWYETTYYYNSNDRLAYKSFERFVAPASSIGDSLFTFYAYNAQGKRSHDSTRSRSSYDPPGFYYVSTYDYTYTTGKIYGFNNGSSPATDTAFIDGNGNATYASLGNGYSIAYLTYDSHPNPWARLSNFSTLEPIPSATEPLLEFTQAHNNILHSISNPPSGWDQNLTGHYIYRTDGYPVSIAEPNTPPATGVDFYYKFVYRNF